MNAKVGMVNSYSFFLWLSWQLKQSDCLECGRKQPFSSLCDVCKKRYQPAWHAYTLSKNTLALLNKTQLFVFVSVPWSQVIRKKWYRYKFLKAYEETGLFVSLLTGTILSCLAKHATVDSRLPHHVWLTHPPAKPNKLYPWARIVQRIAAQQGWHYEPHLLGWQQHNHPHWLQDQKTATSKQARQQQRQQAFAPTNNPKLLQKLIMNPPRVILLLDDIMTTGTTLQGCVVALEALLANLPSETTPFPVIQPIVLTEVPL
jgi:predicted amidophosphoribosyltransferase